MKNTITMKRAVAIFMVIIIFVLLIPSASAAGNGLKIDEENIYEGMDRAYGDPEYRHRVEGGVANIILPLLYDGEDEIAGEKISITLNTRGEKNSPFAPSADGETTEVGLKEHIVNGDEESKVYAYLASFEIPLVENRYNGIYRIDINTSFATKTGKTSKRTIREYIEIEDGKEIDEKTPGGGEEPAPPPPEVIPTPEAAPPAAPPTPEEGGEEEPKPRPQPRIVISEYEVTPEVVMAGESFNVRVVLKNTQKDWDTENIKVSYKGETEYMLPDSNTSTYFIEKIGKGKTHELNLSMKTRLDIEPKPQKILIAIQYEDSAKTAFEVSEEIPVEIKQPIRLEFDEVNIPATVNAGDSLPISMNVLNMGKSVVYNVRCTLDMPGVIPDSSGYIGNMEPGTSSSAEIYAFFGTLDMKSDDSSSGDNKENKDEMGKYGRSEGTMTITYEDEYGEEYEEIIEVATNIERPIFDSMQEVEEEEEEEPERASQWWVSIVLAAGIIMIIYGSMTYKRKMNRLKREYGHEDI